MTKKRKTVVVVVWSMVILAAVVSELFALDLAFSGRTGATWSDNIYRGYSGTEESGTLLTLTAEVEVAEQWGRRSVSLLAGGGWETIESDETATEEIYRFELNVAFPWSSTGQIEGTATTSRETELPETDDVDQGRVLTTRSEFALSMGNQFSPSSSYQATVLQENEETEARDLKENSVILQWGGFLDQRRSVNWQGRMTNAEETVEDISWEEFYASVELSDQISPVISMSYQIDFDTYFGGITEEIRERSYKAGMQVNYEVEKASGWTYDYIIGIDRIKTLSRYGTWEPRAGVSAEGPLSRNWEANAILSHLAELEDPLGGGETEWTGNSLLEIGLVWNVLRTVSIEPSAMYLHEQINIQNDVEREDRTIIFEVNTRWTPSVEWVIEFSGAVERRNGSDQFRDLEERRLEMNLTTTFG